MNGEDNMENSIEYRKASRERVAQMAMVKYMGAGKEADLETVGHIRKIGVEIAEFFEGLESPYEWVPMSLRMEIFLKESDTTSGRRKVGGWDMKAKHWYFSKVLVEKFEGDGKGIMESHGFTHKPHGDGVHHYWINEGSNAFKDFREALPKITNTPLNVDA